MRLIFDTEGNISIIAAQCYSYRKDNDQTANHFGQSRIISPFHNSINTLTHRQTFCALGPPWCETSLCLARFNKLEIDNFNQ